MAELIVGFCAGFILMRGHQHPKLDRIAFIPRIAAGALRTMTSILRRLG